MRGRQYVHVLLLCAAMALLTWLAGWWTVPGVAAVYGAVARGDRTVPGTAAMGGAAAWSLLLVAASVRGDVATVATQIGSIMLVPWYVVVSATVLFPALLAWSAARVGQAIGEGVAGLGSRERPREKIAT